MIRARSFIFAQFCVKPFVKIAKNINSVESIFIAMPSFFQFAKGSWNNLTSPYPFRIFVLINKKKKEEMWCKHSAKIKPSMKWSEMLYLKAFLSHIYKFVHIYTLCSESFLPTRRLIYVQCSYIVQLYAVYTTNTTQRYCVNVIQSLLYGFWTGYTRV